MQRHGGVSRCCQRSTLGSGESPCSTKHRLPFGLRTLRISRRAASGSGIEQRVQVITTVSTALSASGIAAAEPSRSSTGTPEAAARRRAIDSVDELDLLAIQREVQSGADPDFEHASTSRDDRGATVLREVLTSHDQIEERQQYPAFIEIHCVPLALPIAVAKFMALRLMRSTNTSDPLRRLIPSQVRRKGSAGYILTPT